MTDGKTVEELYDPNVNNVLEEIAKLAGQFGAARIIIEGHTDSSMKGQVPAALVKELSLNRANAVKEALVQKYTDLDPNQFNVDGHGLGPAGRPERSAQPRQEPPRRDQGLLGREGELSLVVRIDCESRENGRSMARSRTRAADAVTGKPDDCDAAPQPAGQRPAARRRPGRLRVPASFLASAGTGPALAGRADRRC